MWYKLHCHMYYMHVCLHINFVDMFDQAIKDFSASLEIKESLLPNHDRAIAEL